MADLNRRTFQTKTDEFVVDQLSVPEEKDLQTYQLDKKQSASIIIVIDGQAKAMDFKLHPGFVFFLPALTDLKIANIQKPFTLFRAYFKS